MKLEYLVNSRSFKMRDTYFFMYLAAATLYRNNDVMLR